MSDRYLWDRSGEPDPEIERLEQILGRLRSRRPAPEWPALSRRFRVLPGGGGLREARWLSAAAAAIVLLMCATWLATRPARNGWQVARVEGVPVVGANPIHDTGQLNVGEWLETDAESRATIDVGDIGEVEVEPNSRLRLVRAHWTDHRLALARGTMHATIWAPPRLFSVETPAAVAVDLGCAYTLAVDDAGVTTLHVSIGWVGFESGGHESFVPAGAACVSRPGGRSGTPYFVDASEAFRRALGKLDFEEDRDALAVLLAEARKRDALTLWHLLAKLPDAQRSRVYDQMAQLAPPPAGVTREGILKADQHMFDLWWDALGLGHSSWWRQWKRPSPFPTR